MTTTVDNAHRPLDVTLLQRAPTNQQEQKDQDELRRRLTNESAVAPAPTVEQRLAHRKARAEQDVRQLEQETKKIEALEAANAAKRAELQARRDAASVEIPSEALPVESGGEEKPEADDGEDFDE